MSMTEAFIVVIAGMVIVMVELALLAVIIVIMSRLIRKLSKDKEEKTADSQNMSPAAPVIVSSPASNSVGSTVLESIDNRSAAMVMAIVSDHTGIPLSELCFKSIKALN